MKEIRIGKTVFQIIKTGYGNWQVRKITLSGKVTIKHTTDSMMVDYIDRDWQPRERKLHTSAKRSLKSLFQNN
jgi:hypothetical protein